MKAMEPVCLWDAAAQLGEGVLWHAASGLVYFVDIKQQRILSCAADGSARRIWQAPRQPGFILPTSSGRWLCGMQGGLHYFDPEQVRYTPLCAVEGEWPGNRINDGYTDGQGRLWFGTMDDGESWPHGALYRLSADGLPLKQDDGYVITNGPATSPDGRTLYHTDTLARCTYAFDVSADGGLHNKRVLVSSQQRSGYPDGMAVDAEGCVWIAYFGGWRIDRYSPQGELLSTIYFPCSNITKLAFGGPDLRSVFVTSARKGLSEQQLQRQPLAGALFTLTLDVPGLPLPLVNDSQFAGGVAA